MTPNTGSAGVAPASPTESAAPPLRGAACWTLLLFTLHVLPQALAAEPTSRPTQAAAPSAASARAQIESLRGIIRPGAKPDTLEVDLQFANPGSVTDDRLPLLGTLGRITVLRLKNTRVTDAGLIHVGTLTNLQQLHLENTAITDAGLRHLDRLIHLEALNLFGTAVTEAGLEPIQNLPRLRRLYLWQTRVTIDAIARLQQARPELAILPGSEDREHARTILETATNARRHTEARLSEATKAAEQLVPQTAQLNREHDAAKKQGDAAKKRVEDTKRKASEAKQAVDDAHAAAAIARRRSAEQPNDPSLFDDAEAAARRAQAAADAATEAVRVADEARQQDAAAQAAVKETRERAERVNKLKQALEDAQILADSAGEQEASARRELEATHLPTSTLFAHPLNTWIKRSPLTIGPPSPRLGYEGACAWDSKHKVLIRYGGHNQGGGGEQGSEVWTYDPMTARWSLKEPNTSPPGVCCNAQNVFDPVAGRYLRFPSFSGSHGWQWWREIYLNESSVWSYDLAANAWRNLRPLPAPKLAPLRCAAWDSDAQLAVVFGGEGGPRETLAYDPHRNEWRWLKPALQPEPRSGGQMAYDAARQVHVMFGSQFNDDTHTWIYDLKKNEWRDAQPASSPPTDQNDAVLTYDPVAKTVLALVKITTGQDDAAMHRLESWAYDVARNQWNRLNPSQEPAPSGNRARQLIFAPELGLALLENCPSKPREQQIWTYRLSNPPPAAATAPLDANARPRTGPRIVEDAVVSVVSPTRIELSWTAPANRTATAWQIERAPVEVLSEDQLVRLKQQTPPLAEPSIGAIRRIGPFTRLHNAPLTQPQFSDTTINLSQPAVLAGQPIYEHQFSREQLDDLGRPYRFGVFAYRIVALDAAGESSGPSPALFSFPSPPQWVSSRETNAACQLKWTANPERALQGYRVYRMNGRYDKDPIVRLTADPISKPGYLDPEAGHAPRRYYIVAVDALGQEGLPSSPVWINREWKQYYREFTGDWHQ